MGRLNGVLGGVLAAESFVLSQSYYFGRVSEHYRVLVTWGDPDEGECVDELHELDAIAIGKPGTLPDDNGGGERAPVELDLFEQRVQALGRKLKTGDGRRDLLKTWVCSRSARGMGEADLMLQVEGIVSRYFDPCDGIDWADVGALVRDTVRKDRRPDVDLSEFLERPDAAQSVEIDPETGEIVPAAAEPKGFEFVRAGDLLNDLRPANYLVDELIEHESLALLFAPPSAGKSFLAIP